MKSNNSFEIFQQIFQYFLKKLKIFVEKLENFDKTYPHTSQNFQLTFVYLFALVDLVFSMLLNVFSYSYSSEFLDPLFPYVENILQSTFLKIWTSPEKVFLLSYFVLDFMVIRESLNFSKFIKFNVLLVFALLMLQNLVFSFWDLLFQREITQLVQRWSFDEGLIISSNRELAVFFFLLTFIVFLLIYLFFFLNALKSKIVTIKYFEWLTDSVAFWLRIKTPTMKFREDQNDFENDSEET
jgi:magnesium-transporting ATPase (P-type)